ncbi:MAG: hypothetical protein AAFY11_00335 [Cyanobacteria bacterium J06641_5]
MNDITPKHPLLTDLQPEQFAQYLRDRGWWQVPHPNQRVSVFQRGEVDDEGRSIEIAVPGSSEYWDAKIVLALGVNLAAFVEERSPERILEDIWAARANSLSA